MLREQRVVQLSILVTLSGESQFVKRFNSTDRSELYTRPSQQTIVFLPFAPSHQTGALRESALINLEYTYYDSKITITQNHEPLL